MTRLLVLALVVLAVAPASASAWTSPVFHSPSGNIRCAYRAWNESLTCVTVQPRQSVSVTASGYPRVGRGWLPLRGPALRYGDFASNHLFSCYSRSYGMTCGSDESGHGFSIAREGVTRW